MLPIPTCAQSECLALTYQRLPGSSPTSRVPSPGWWPAAVSAATRPVSSSRIAAAVALPSRIVAGTTDSLPERPHDRRRGPRLRGRRLPRLPMEVRDERGTPIRDDAIRTAADRLRLDGAAAPTSPQYTDGRSPSAGRRAWAVSC